LVVVFYFLVNLTACTLTVELAAIVTHLRLH
jgi:hypothetical protein